MFVQPETKIIDNSINREMSFNIVLLVKSSFYIMGPERFELPLAAFFHLLSNLHDWRQPSYR